MESRILEALRNVRHLATPLRIFPLLRFLHMNTHKADVNRCATFLVDDVPASDDSFGSHDPIADALHELIVSEPGGRTIGLEGSWGSGKSTVVRMLARRFDGPDAKVVVFDAWAHEGDPLRRSFLEKLIESQTEQRWVNERAWGNRREELARRRRVEHTRPVPNLQTGAIVAGIVAVAIAIFLSAGAALLEAGFAQQPKWPFWVGVSLHGVIALVVAGGFLEILRRQRSGTTDGAWLSLFSVQSVTESTNETIETPDPTSIEFESTFKDLMREALNSHSNRRLVLVLDNLDRVAAEDARAIWSTLQTFLHHQHDDREPWLDRLWVLLPYDRSGIVDRWMIPDYGADRKPLEADSFIEKSIQLRWEVPLPVLSAWREYLTTILDTALPKCIELDSYVAYRLYAYRLANDDARPPSPRELKQYVNRIGALHRRWQHQLPFASLAYYASLDCAGSEIADRLRKNELPEAGVEGLITPDAADHMAAIAFGSEPTRARQLLLGPLIDHALSSNDSSAIVELTERHGFWDALLQSPIVGPGIGVASLLTAAQRLVKLPVSKRRDEKWNELISTIAYQASNVEAWPALSRDSAERLQGLLSLVPQPVANDIARRVTDVPIPEAGSAEWAAGAHTLLLAFHWLGVRASGSPIAVRDTLAHFVQFQGWPDCADRFTIEPSARASLDEVIVEQIADAPESALGSLTALSSIDGEVDWERFAIAAYDRLRERPPSRGRHVPSDAHRSRWLLRILRSAGTKGEKQRADLAREGFTLEYIQLAHQQEAEDALGDWFNEELREFPPGRRTGRRYSEYAARGKALVDSLVTARRSQYIAILASSIEQLEDFDSITSIGGSSQGEALAGSLVAALSRSELFLAAMDGERFRALWPHIRLAGDSGDLEIRDFVRVVSSRESFTEELQTAPFSAGLMRMYETAVGSNADSAAAASLARWICDAFTGFALEEWQSTMEGSDDWVELLATVHQAAPDASIGGAYTHALSWYLDLVADGADISTPVKENWMKALVPLLSRSLRGAYVEGVVRSANRVGGKLPGVFFAIVGETLSDPSVFRRREIRDWLLADLVNERNDAGIAWLARTLEEGNTRRRMKRGELDSLREALRAFQVDDSLGQSLRRGIDSLTRYFSRRESS